MVDPLVVEILGRVRGALKFTKTRTFGTDWNVKNKYSVLLSPSVILYHHSQTICLWREKGRKREEREREKEEKERETVCERERDAHLDVPQREPGGVGARHIPVRTDREIGY